MKKILIVDDEFLIRFTLEEGLKDRGYETQSAETVKDALEKMKTFHPQVILLDNRLQASLPRKSEWENTVKSSFLFKVIVVNSKLSR